MEDVTYVRKSAVLSASPDSPGMLWAEFRQRASHTVRTLRPSAETTLEELMREVTANPVGACAPRGCPRGR